MIKLHYIGTDDWSRPVYKDETGKLWKDVNLGSGIPHLCSSSNNSFDGEPDIPIMVEFEIVTEENIMQFRYMMLGRLKSDCDYFLGHGNRCPKNLWGINVVAHIKEMKSIWNSFSDTDKPKWLTWEDIVNYEREMIKDEDYNI